MIGDIKYPASWPMDQLARNCQENENWSFARLTSLASMQPSANRAHFVPDQAPAPLNDLEIVPKGTAPNAASTLLFTANIYVNSKLTDVDVYRHN